MKFSILTIFLGLILLSFPVVGADDSSLIAEDFLWLEYNDAVKQKDGSLILEIRIRYGIFSDKVKDLSEFKELKAFYHASDDQGRKAHYKTEIHKSSSGYSVIIRSAKTTRYTLRVTGIRKGRSKQVHYLAKASFTLFGKAISKGTDTDLPSDNSLGYLPEINIDPEHHYWPQTGNPYRVSIKFNDENLSEQKITLFDEHLNPAVLNISETGDAVYIPPDDKLLNSMGETAYKQTVLVSKYAEGGKQYISSYTMLLHRSRYGKHEHKPGLIVFGSAFAIFLFFMIIKRMRAGF